MHPNLTYFVERLQGVSTNTFRLESQNKTTAKENDIISFDLPSNAILNLKSLKVWCNASCDPGVAGGVASGSRLPPINDLVERVEVSVGGIVLSQGTNFSNVLQEAQRALTGEELDACTAHPEYVRNISYVDGFGSLGAASLTTNVNESYPLDENVQKFCIDKFPGFLDSAAPSLLDTSILPDIRVRLYMATSNLLTTSVGVGLGDGAGVGGFADGFAKTGGLGQGKYILGNIHATIEALGMADENYDRMIESQMSQQGYLEIPFKSYTTFQENHSGSSRFTVSTSSLDRVWVAWRATDPNEQSPPVIVNGYKKQGAYIMGQVADGSNAQLDLGKPQYDVGGVLDTNKEKYKSKYFNFVQPAADMKMQLQLNGAYMPQFSANLGELYGISKNSLLGTKGVKNMSYDQYVNNYCVQCFRLNLPDCEFSRTLSGLDTRSVNLQGVVKTVGASAANATINIFTEETSVLRCGPGRSIEILS